MSISCWTFEIHGFAKGDMAQMMQMQKMIKSYQMAEREAAAESGDAHMLIAALLDELLRRMNRYVDNFETKSSTDNNEHFARSLTILHSLQDCLDFENGGEIAENLFRLYEYSRQQILMSLTSKDISGVRSAITYLTDISEAWKQIGKTSPGQSATKSK